MTIGTLRTTWKLLILLAVLLAPLTPLAAQDEAQEQIERHLAVGKALLDQGDPAAAQSEFRAILRIDATNRDALRLMTAAQLRLEAQRNEARAPRQEAAPQSPKESTPLNDALQEQARQLADTFAKDKARAQDAAAKQAGRQIALAREQQIKLLYNRGMRLYREGAYPDAISAFQHMVTLDPAHPLVRSAQEQITRTEIKLAELKAKAGMRGLAGGATAVPELERQLAAKRIEMDTAMKYARLAMKDKDYDLALQSVQRVLAQDPTHDAAQKLLAEIQLAKAQQDRHQLERLVKQDEAEMLNDVVRAQLTPPVATPVSASATSQSPAAVHERLSQPISFSFENVPLADVLAFIGDAASISIIPSPQLDLRASTVTLKVQDMPLEQAIKYLAKSQGLAYRIEPDAVLIAQPEEFANAMMETRAFLLHSGLGPFALETAAITSNPSLTMSTLKELIESSIPQPPESKIVLDERSGSLVATNTPENLELLQDLLTQLDVAPLQVLIEARFIELTMTELEQKGVEAILTGNFAFDKKGAAGGTQGPGTQLTSGSGIKFPAISRESEGANLTLQGVLTGTQFELVLHALEENSKSKTLSAPRVSTLNNQTALIRVVDEFRYPTRYEVSLIQFDINGDGDFDDAGETEFANVPQDFQKRDIGILMAVTPSVGQDGKTITLILSPEVSAFSQFRTLEGGVVVPEFTSSQLTTSVAIESGQTAVLGGLMKDSVSDTTSKVPFFGDLPVVGGMFRQTRTTNTRKNLIIFITARILAPRTERT